MSDHAPGMVGVISQDTARFSAFLNSLLGLTVPVGTIFHPVLGHDIPHSRNVLVREFLSVPSLEWIFFLDDDHQFGHDLLSRLLARDVDYVTAICLTRLPPYWPIPIEDTPEGAARVDLSRHPRGGMIPILRGGGSGLLVRRVVFEQLSEPWFEYGKLHPAREGDDIYLTDKARMAGFETFCDLDAPLGHMVTGSVWPVRDPAASEWGYGFAMAGGLSVPMGPWPEVQIMESDAALVRLEGEQIPR